MKHAAMILAALVAITSSALAKAYFQNETELVTKASAIAVVTISEPKVSEQKGAVWTYRQAASAKVVETIKGNLPDTITLHGDETFICAQCHLAAGTYLAFLSQDGGLWVGANWNLSLRPIKGDEIEWYVTSEQRQPMKYQPRLTVLDRVKSILASHVTKDDQKPQQ